MNSFLKKINITTILFFFFGTVLILIVSKYTSRVSGGVFVTKKTEIIDAVVLIPQNRGAIILNDTLLINSSSRLVYKQRGFDMSLFNGPVTDIDKKPYAYKLGDLSIPYQISKRSNSDTLLVKKDKWILKFLLN